MSEEVIEAPATPEPGPEAVETSTPEQPGEVLHTEPETETPIQEGNLLGGEEDLPEQGESELPQGEEPEPEQEPAPHKTYEEITTEYEGKLEFSEGDKAAYEKAVELGFPPEKIKEFLDYQAELQPGLRESGEKVQAEMAAAKRAQELETLKEKHPEAFAARPQIKAFIKNQPAEDQEVLIELAETAKGVAYLNRLRAKGAQVTGTGDPYQVKGSAGTYSRAEILKDWNSTIKLPEGERAAKRAAIKARAQQEGEDQSWVATFF